MITMVRRFVNGHMTFGQGKGNFATSDEAIRQRIGVALRMLQGTWFLDTTAGTPWLQSILGQYGALALVEPIIRAKILSVDGVVAVNNLTVTQVAMTYVITGDVQTINSKSLAIKATI